MINARVESPIEKPALKNLVRSRRCIHPRRWLLLVSPSLHAIIKDLLLVVTAGKSGVTLALVQVTVIVALTLGFVRAERLPGGAAYQKDCRNNQ